MCSNEEIQQSITDLADKVATFAESIVKVQEANKRMLDLHYDLDNRYEAFGRFARTGIDELGVRMMALETQKMTLEDVKTAIIEALDSRHVVTQDGIIGAIFHSIQDGTRWAAVRTIGLIFGVASIVTAINHLSTLIQWITTHVLF